MNGRRVKYYLLEWFGLSEETRSRFAGIEQSVAEVSPLQTLAEDVCARFIRRGLMRMVRGALRVYLEERFTQRPAQNNHSKEENGILGPVRRALESRHQHLSGQMVKATKCDKFAPDRVLSFGRGISLRTTTLSTHICPKKLAECRRTDWRGKVGSSRCLWSPLAGGVLTTNWQRARVAK